MRARLCSGLLGGLFAAAIPAVAWAEDVAGRFDYYVLSLSWSPSYCALSGKANRSPQCRGTRPYAFVLHGLWPQYERGYPENCKTAQRPWVPSTLISSMLDIMPARGLVIHQYRKHGTCSGLDPEAYFRAARKAYDAVTVPARYRSPEKPIFVSPKEVEQDFLRANAALGPEMVSVTCGRGSRLREIRICFTRDIEFRACGVNEEQARLCRLDKVVMPPVRGG